MSEREEYEKLIELLNDRLARLRSRQAGFGENVPASLAQEIQELERELERLEVEMTEKYPEREAVVTVGGNFVTGGGVLVGGDFVTGDKIGGDKLTVGDISSIYGVEIGSSVAIKGGQQPAAQPGDREQFKKLFIPLLEHASQAEPDIRSRVLDLTNELVIEMMSGASLEEDQRVASLVDMLVSTQPSSKDLVIKTFRAPVMRGMTGPVTNWMIERLESR
jgi:hypothetical protein